MATSVIMPQLGESVVDGTILKWLKKVGDPVTEFEPLLEVETVKVTSEIPSPASGTLLQIVVPEGQTVLAKTVLAWIGQPGEKLPDGDATVHVEETILPERNAAPQSEVHSGRNDNLGFISPVVARIAREKGVDLTRVQGTGHQGRITKKDLLSFLEGSVVTPAKAAGEVPAWETPGSGDLFKPTEMLLPHPAAGGKVLDQMVSAKGGEETLLPLTSARKAIADHMVMSKHTSAHVTTVMEADLSRVVLDRQAKGPGYQREGVHLTYTPYFIAAVCHALREFPLLNSSWSDQGIRLHREIHIGLAVSLGKDGLIVPVIRNADHLSLLGLAKTVNDLAERARARRLKPDEVTGGTFSITNHGTGGSLFASPIINQPQVGILGVGTIQKRVVVIQDAIAIRPMVYLSLTFDHRVLDGSTADGFLRAVVSQLEQE